jgi:hypothetical protein
MSKYKDEYSDNNRICPYCEYTYQVEGEDYSEDEKVEECGECGKKFHAYESFYVAHHSVPDCALNGQAHDWDAPVNAHGRKFVHCKTCEQCEILKGGEG